MLLFYLYFCMIEILTALLAFILGAIFVFLWQKNKTTSLQTALQEALKESSVLQASYAKTEEQLAQSVEDNRQLHEQVAQLREARAGLDSTLQHLQEKLSQQLAEQTKTEEQMLLQFEKLANTVLDKNSEKFSNLNKERIGAVLNPLKEKIEHFSKKVEDNHQHQHLHNGLLKEEISRLANLHQQMSADTRNLTLALKGDNKFQGNWGEVILTRVLESSGLQEGREYILQGKTLQLQNEDGKSQKPDVIIQLPENKHIIIDAKVSIKAYEGYTTALEPAEKNSFLKIHLDSLRRHVKGLSEKHYYANPKMKTPDFVLLFVPVEAAFSLALQEDRENLFNYAWERKVIIVSPTTLLACLKTVSSIWKYEHQNQNAQEIAQEAGKMYDKFTSFLQDLEKIGRNLGQTQNAYDEAVKKLSQGKGNLLNKAHHLKQLGVPSKKNIGNDTNFVRHLGEEDE